MMKNIKRFTLLAMLAGSIAILMASCSFKMNTSQQTHYDAFIATLVGLVAQAEMSPGNVKSHLETNNVAAKAIGYQIVDKNAGKPIARGTGADALKKRFVPKKA